MDSVAVAAPPPSLDDLLGALRGADFAALTSNEIAAYARRLKRQRGDRADVKIAYLGSYTLEPLPGFVDVRCACAGIVSAPWLGQFNQYMQEVLDERSPLRGFAPDLILLFVALRDLFPGLERFGALSRDDKAAAIEDVVVRLRGWAEAAKAASGASLLIANFPVPDRSRAGIADLKDAFGEVEFHTRLNLALLEAFRDDRRAHVLDLDRIVARHGRTRSANPRLRFLAKMEWDAGLAPHLADEIYRYVHALTGRTRKCLVLDLDNTLWGGVVGEEGVDGVKIGPGDPAGEAFEAFQHAVLALKDRGVILAACSKNNPADALAVFRERAMPIKEEDFAALRINWQNKADNLVEIAAELNIGVDSLVFVDDNPAECEIVRQLVPGVRVIELPDDPAEYADVLARLVEFETLRVSDDDRGKARQYAENRQRAALAHTAGDLGSYLRSLETRLSFRPAEASDAARVHQLFAKTNQFNLTTRRYSMADVERFLAEPGYDLRVAEASDRFGDLGKIAVVLIERDGDEARIDSFLMSCRVMGREVESAMMNRIKEDYLVRGDCRVLHGTFVATAKNAPVREFYDRQGFARDAQGQDETTYRLQRDDCTFIDCGHISRIDAA